MNFGFSPEQDLLRNEVRKFLDEQCPMDEVRRVMQTQAGYSSEQWKQLAELGWLGLILPEKYGGTELAWVDLMVLLEETGRSLFPSPFLSTTLAAALLLEAASTEQQARWLPKIADGSVIATVASGEDATDFGPRTVQLEGKASGEDFVLNGSKRFVADASAANLFLVAFRSGPGPLDLSLALIPSGNEGVSVQDAQPLDATKRSGTLVLENVRVSRDQLLGEPGQAADALAHHEDRGAIAVAAEVVGTGEAALAMTVQYAKDRIQFGSPIGRYQGVKHPLAEIYVDLECLKSLLYHAAWAIDAAPEEVSLAASKAKAFASEAIGRIGVHTIQLHGGIGYTEESDVHLYLRRSKWARPAFGDEDYHYERVTALGEC